MKKFITVVECSVTPMSEGEFDLSSESKAPGYQLLSKGYLTDPGRADWVNEDTFLDDFYKKEGGLPFGMAELISMGRAPIARMAWEKKKGIVLYTPSLPGDDSPEDDKGSFAYTDMYTDGWKNGWLPNNEDLLTHDWFVMY